MTWWKSRHDQLADEIQTQIDLETQENIERQTSHGAGRIERLCYGYERGIPFVEPLDDLGEVSERAGEPVDLIDDHHVNPALVDV